MQVDVQRTALRPGFREYSVTDLGIPTRWPYCDLLSIEAQMRTDATSASHRPPTANRRRADSGQSFKQMLDS